MRSWAAALCLAIVGLAGGVGCTDERLGGVRMNVCGEYIAQGLALVGVTWYQDASVFSSSLDLPYFAADPAIAGTWLRVSDSCATGATIVVSTPRVLAISDAIRAADGRYVAVRITPRSLGAATVSISSPTASTHRVSVHVVRAQTATSYPAPSGTTATPSDAELRSLLIDSARTTFGRTISGIETRSACRSVT
jgi:hypothetical protein